MWPNIIMAILVMEIILIIILAIRVESLKADIETYNSGMRTSDAQDITNLELKVTELECKLKEETEFEVIYPMPLSELARIFTAQSGHTIRVGLKEKLDSLEINIKRCFGRADEARARHDLLCQYLKVQLASTPAKDEYVKIK